MAKILDYEDYIGRTVFARKKSELEFNKTPKKNRSNLLSINFQYYDMITDVI